MATGHPTASSTTPKDEQHMNTIRLLPYGIPDFKQIQREGNYIVDKTKYVSLMEKTDHFIFLIRPRHFGKRRWSSATATATSSSCPT